MKSLHVAITVDPYIPVPPNLYGGIERVVDFLVRGLIARGHEVSLFAHPESRTEGTLFPYGVPPHTGLYPRCVELMQAGTGLWRLRNDIDIIHSFGRLAALVPVLQMRNLPKLQSYQRDVIPWRSIQTAVLLAGDSIRFTACSASVFRNRPEHGKYGGSWHAIFNGVDISKYTFVSRVTSEAPLVFLGRLESIKGVHNAISISKITGKKLIIAGNKVTSGQNLDYFDREIAPHLDGDHISYIGPVDDQQKNVLLGSAAALLMPIEWEEPFGIVMAEAMACGTPVIAFPRGSVGEVIRDGLNGYICQTIDEAAGAVHRLNHIDRTAVRTDCVNRFGNEAIIDAYERLYQEMLLG